MGHPMRAGLGEDFGPDGGPSSAGKLLIVDDLADNRDLLGRRFKRRGFQIEEAENGRAALRLLAAQEFDCVLLDMMMPGMNGDEVLRLLRQDFSAQLLPVIMVTARAQQEDVAKATKLGANEYVTKPVDFAVALAHVRTLVARRRQEIERMRANEAWQRNELRGAVLSNRSKSVGQTPPSR